MTLENNNMNIGNNLTIELVVSIMNQTPYTIVVASPDGKFIFWNKAAFQLFKKELVDSEQSNWVADWGCFRIDKITEYKTEDIPLSRALKGETVYNEKMYLETAGRDGIYLKISAFPILDENEKVKAGVVMCENITDEQILYESIINKISDLEDYIQELILNKPNNETVDKP